jgi:hypothetical protein
LSAAALVGVTSREASQAPSTRCLLSVNTGHPHFTLPCDSLPVGLRGKLQMTIAIGASEEFALSQDRLSGTSRSNVIDRWIYVFTAASFIAIVLTGFVPDSLAKLTAIHAGQRPPFPLVLHVHAILMGSFLLLLLSQTILVAVGKRSWHMRIGIAAAALVPAIVSPD